MDRGLPPALAKGGSIPPFEPHAAPAQLLILTLVSASTKVANGLLSSQLAGRPDLPTRQLHSVRATERGRARQANPSLLGKGSPCCS
ncbi:unknown protein [Desulfotalea psychrophila LSv54]|uniref:Uncharacterized protein n=1 Tax=Desulfotalea psychrophila (strain LSv54 / DSM 12343) TaxID=177439 RepID=Q6AKQ3_DESPS|nr:unknown protein [Desulfotalea psychrophila LSv54]